MAIVMIQKIAVIAQFHYTFVASFLSSHKSSMTTIHEMTSKILRLYGSILRVIGCNQGSKHQLTSMRFKGAAQGGCASLLRKSVKTLILHHFSYLYIRNLARVFVAGKFLALHGSYNVSCLPKVRVNSINGFPLCIIFKHNSFFQNTIANTFQELAEHRIPNSFLLLKVTTRTSKEPTILMKSSMYQLPSSEMNSSSFQYFWFGCKNGRVVLDEKSSCMLTRW